MIEAQAAAEDLQEDIEAHMLSNVYLFLQHLTFRPFSMAHRNLTKKSFPLVSVSPTRSWEKVLALVFENHLRRGPKLDLQDMTSPLLPPVPLGLPSC